MYQTPLNIQLSHNHILLENGPREFAKRHSVYRAVQLNALLDESNYLAKADLPICLAHGREIRPITRPRKALQANPDQDGLLAESKLADR